MVEAEQPHTTVLTPSQYHYNRGSRTLQSNLTILQPQPVDAAEYVCVASNDIATDMASAVLTVHGR